MLRFTCHLGPFVRVVSGSIATSKDVAKGACHEPCSRSMRSEWPSEFVSTRHKKRSSSRGGRILKPSFNVLYCSRARVQLSTLAKQLEKPEVVDSSGALVLGSQSPLHIQEGFCSVLQRMLLLWHGPSHSLLQSEWLDHTQNEASCPDPRT